MRNRRVVLALAGTLILVGTTVVRDIMREPIKDQLNQLQNAILVYQSQNEVMHLTIRLVDFINETTNYIHNSYTASGKQAKPEEVILFGLHTIDERVVEDQDIFTNVKLLLDALGDPEPETREFRDYKGVTDGYGALLALLLKKQSDGTWNKFDSQSLDCT